MVLLALRMLIALRQMPDDAREPDPHTELATSSADCRNPEDVSSETVELTAQVVPQTDSSVCGRPSR